MDKHQIKARFIGMHIGCRYQYVNPDFPSMVPAVFTNHGLIEEDCGNYRIRNENGFNKQSFGDCKLILRSLSSITDDELTHAWRLMFSMVPSMTFDRFKSAWDVKCRPSGDKHPVDVADYFRSINICLPFCGLDPIEEGWAVLDEKISANETEKTT